MIVKRIKALPNPDWQLWTVFAEFMAFFDPVVAWKGASYRFETGVIQPAPLVCGTDLRAVADLVVDNGSHHWLPYFRNWAQSAGNSGVRFLNNWQTYRTLDKHHTYDVLARAMHPRDRLPVTVLLPEFAPYTAEQRAQERWEHEQQLAAEHTSRGFDPSRRATDWDAVRAKERDREQLRQRLRRMRAAYYPRGNYLAETVEGTFGGRFPLYLKPALGFGGAGVHRVNSLDELYERYDRTRGEAFHLQEAVEGADLFVRCISVGPQVRPIRYLPDRPYHERYGVDVLRLDASISERLRHYVRFVNAYYRWSHSSFEALLDGGSIHPIDCANACPDSAFLALHVHFLWLVCALVRWCTFVVVADVDLRVDTEHARYARVLNDRALTAEEKYAACARLTREYFRHDEFEEYCRGSLSGLEEAMVRYYDSNKRRVVDALIAAADVREHDRFVESYLARMENTFRPDAAAYLAADAWA